MRLVRISKLSSNKNTFETKLPLEGYEVLPPSMNYPYMVATDEGATGGLRTSIVKSVEVIEDGLILNTLNSVYKVEVLQENV